MSRSVLRWPSSRAGPSRLLVSLVPLPLSWWWLLTSTRGPIGGGRLLLLLIVGSDDERAPRLLRASRRVGEWMCEEGEGSPSVLSTSAGCLVQTTQPPFCLRGQPARPNLGESRSQTMYNSLGLALDIVEDMVWSSSARAAAWREPGARVAAGSVDPSKMARTKV